MEHFFETEIKLFYEKSLIRRLILWLNKIDIPFTRGFEKLGDDQVSPLESSPLGMYIYNLRIAFTFLSTGFIFCLTCLSIYLDWWKTLKVQTTLYMTWVALLISIISTLTAHRQFRKKLLKFEEQEFIGLNKLFQSYFVIDKILLISTIVIGAYFFQVSTEAITFVFIANVIIFGVYTGGNTTKDLPSINPARNLLIPFIEVSVAVGWYVIQSVSIRYRFEPELFYILFSGGAIIGSIWVALFSVITISFIRRKELFVSQHRLNLIVSLAGTITEPTSDVLDTTTSSGNKIIHEGIKDLLKAICSPLSHFDYKIGRVWMIETCRENSESQATHQDINLLTSYSTIRGFALPKYEKQYLLGIKDIHQTIISSKMTSLLIPIQHQSKQSGILELFRAQPLLITRQEKGFLNSLSEIMYIAEKLFKTTQETLALKEVDAILSCSTLIQAYEKTLSLLHKYLSAQGSMLLLLTPGSIELDLVSSRGFDKATLAKNKYFVGNGYTGKSVQTSELKLTNDVERDKELFNPNLLSNLNSALGHKVSTWMAIPFGKEDNILGLVKVVNKAEGFGTQFTKYDESLAEKLAFKLGIVLEKFIHINKAIDAEIKAQERAQAADEQKNKAETQVKERQEDLTILAHQLQGPLHASLGRISLILEENRLSPWLRKHIEFSNSLLNDSLDLIFGVLIATGLDAGVSPSFNQDKIIAREETKSLVERIGRTNDRPELKFEYSESEDFPPLHVDRKVYRSVLYTLIHNATKYADRGSTVYIECGFEWPQNNQTQKYPAIKVKTIGTPILPAEKKEIFKKYYRGKNVVSTAKHGTPGIGLGLWVAKNLMLEVGGDLILELDDRNIKHSIFVIQFKESEK